MARGFAAGLLHGALICGAGLAAVSLVLPQPPLPVTQAALQTPTVPETPPASDAPALSPVQSPVADTLEVPAGSGFGRGQDMAPTPPAAIAPVTPRVAATPAVVRPPNEAAPAPADPAALPEARGDAPAAPVMQAPAPDPIDLPRVAADGPLPVAPPGKVETPGLDRLPEQVVSPDLAPNMALSVPEPAFALPDEPPPTPVAAQQAIEAAISETLAETPAGPTLQSTEGSGFDLSTPPDFGALRLTPPNE